MSAKKILVVDDDEKILFAFGEVLKKDGFICIVAKDGDEALEKSRSSAPDVVFMDMTMPKLNGLEALQQIKQQFPLLPVIIITGYGTMQTAIKAMQYGAFEYMTKPLDLDKVREVMYRALESGRNEKTTTDGNTIISADIVDRYELIGKSAVMQDIYKLIGSISTTPNHTSVLILGESGTGKELVARAVHANSSGASQPFVGINCTVLPEPLLESELFGYEKGTFTGANERKIGKFEIAGNGSIFLDEIGNLSLPLQQKLLRVLQEREFERLGGNDLIPVKARFIAATNTDIENEVKNKNFREDLFYRLNVVMIHLPPLRQRKDDIPLLANYFLSKYNDHLKKTIKGFSDDAMSLLRMHSYPGNVRELENMIERAVMLSRGEIILSDSLREVNNGPVPEGSAMPVISQIFSTSRNHVLELFEKQFIIEQLSKYHGNVTIAAQSSGMTRQNFQRLMQKFKIESEPFRK